MAKADHVWEEVKERYARMKTYRHVESGLSMRVQGTIDEETFSSSRLPNFLMKASLSFKRPDNFNFSRWSTMPDVIKGHQLKDNSASVVGNPENFVVNRPKEDQSLVWFSKIFPRKDGSSFEEIDRNIFKCIPAVSTPFTYGIIPSLLTDKIELPKDTIASPLKSLLLPDQVVDGHNCYHIILYNKKMNPRHFWIDKEMYVIRQTRLFDELSGSMEFTNWAMQVVFALIPKMSKMKFDYSDVSLVVYNMIEINQEIPDHVFDPANVSASRR